MILCSSAQMALNASSIPLYINLTQKSRYICHESSKSSGTTNENHRPQSNQRAPGNFSLKDKSNSELKGGFSGESAHRWMEHNTSVIGADTNVNPHRSLRMSSYSYTLVLSTSQGDASEDGSSTTRRLGRDWVLKQAPWIDLEDGNADEETIKLYQARTFVSADCSRKTRMPIRRRYRC